MAVLPLLERDYPHWRARLKQPMTTGAATFTVSVSIAESLPNGSE